MHFLKILTKDLIQRYDPDGLILHGSYANGYAKEHSDYDVFVLLRNQTKEVVTYILEGKHIDACAVYLPLTLEDKWSNFIPQLAQGNILYDKEQQAQKVYDYIQKLFVNGPAPLSSVEIQNRKNLWSRSIGRLEDYVDHPIIFTEKLGTFYERMARYFMEKRMQWSQPTYKALEYIQTNDKYYYGLMEQISMCTDNAKKIELCKNAYRYIFDEAI